MTQPTNVDVEAMRVAHQEIDEKKTTITHQLEQASQEFADLKSSWGGEASDKFMSAIEVFKEDGQNIMNQLAKISDKLQQTTGGYNTAHNATVDAAQQMSARMSTPSAGLNNF